MATKPLTKQPKDLPTRLFDNFYFAISWLVFLAIMTRGVGWPLRNFFLVWWVYGREAYIRDGVRVVSSKPTRFSTGALAPELPDLVTGFGEFIVVALGLTMLLIFLLRLYERLVMNRAR